MYTPHAQFTVFRYLIFSLVHHSLGPSAEFAYDEWSKASSHLMVAQPEAPGPELIMGRKLRLEGEVGAPSGRVAFDMVCATSRIVKLYTTRSVGILHFKMS